MSNRTTAAAVVMIAPSVDAEGALQLQVRREFRYLRANQRGQRAKRSIHRLRTYTLVFAPETPETWGDVWYKVFDLAFEMVKSRPAQRQWCVQRDGLGEYATGAVEMLSRSIAVELGFEMVSDDGLQMTA